MSSEERYHRYQARRGFYSSLREDNSAPSPLPHCKEEEEEPSLTNLILTPSPSSPLSSRPLRGSMVSRPFKAFTLQLADTQASISSPNRTAAAYTPYIRPSDFRASRWLHKLNDIRSNHRCVCIHGIGGSHVDFLPWKSRFEYAGVELYAVCLPGRSVRCLEPSIPFVQHAAQAIVDAMVELDLVSSARSLSFFGHSLGALIAYECVQLLLNRYSSTLAPIHLFISSCPNPIALSNFNKDPFVTKTCEVSNHQLYELLLKENWLNKDMLRRINSLYLTLFRADLKLFEEYIILESSSHNSQNLLRGVPIMAFELKADDAVAMFSEDFYSLRQNNFEYAWDSVSTRSDTVYLRYDGLDPYFFISDNEITDAILSIIL